MTYLKNNPLLLTLGTFLIINGFIYPSCGKSIMKRENGQPHIPDAPSEVPVNDQVRKYAQQGVDKLNESGSKSELGEISKVTFFPPAGKLMYEIKTTVKDSAKVKDCTVQVWRERDGESVTVECGKSSKRKRDTEVQDKPSKTNVDDDQVKKYAQQGVDKLNMSGEKVVLQEVLEATFFPPAGKLMYEVKIKVKGMENADNMKTCTVQVMRESGPEVSVDVKCDGEKKKRATDEMSKIQQPYIADQSVNVDVKSPQIVDSANQGLALYAKKFPDSKVEIVEIMEALYSPVSAYSHTIKVKFGKCPKDKENCKQETEMCNIYVPGHNAPVTMKVECGKN